jgi:prepilin-type N-terminal cleavage/methylation domain-containing protein
MPSRIHLRRAGFTLIEVIVVIAIITVLTAITAGAGYYMYNQAGRSATEATLTSLSSATLKYKTERGVWPWQVDPLNTADNGRGWFREITRRREASGSFREAYFPGGDRFAPDMTPVAWLAADDATNSGVNAQTLGRVNNRDTGADAWMRVFDAWNNVIALCRIDEPVPGGGGDLAALITSRRGFAEANNGLPVFQSRGPGGGFAGDNYAGVVVDATRGYIVGDTDDLFSFCGTDY